ncbi:MAG: hypothetical protein H7831_13790 [Magnetococcus sp. WYHC-3]
MTRAHDSTAGQDGAGTERGAFANHAQSSILPLVDVNDVRCQNCSAAVLNQFAKSFDKSARRWELIVYPSLFAFIVLAMYGFYLILSLTQDIRTMAMAIDPQMESNMGSLSSHIKLLSDNMEMMSEHLAFISDNMETMSQDMQTVAKSVRQMDGSVQGMSANVSEMTTQIRNIDGHLVVMSKQLDTLDPMSRNMASMTEAIQFIGGSVGRMGYDMRGATRPMSFMNSFMPW